jgi:hypothetical protein
MKIIIGLAAPIFLFCAFVTGCSQKNESINETSFRSLNDVPSAVWEKLAEKKIYFGHQSVGSNIISGISEIMAGNSNIKLTIVETEQVQDLSKPIFAHSKIGRNTESKTKIGAFKELMDKGIGNKADIAFFKLCFVDVLAQTDVDKLFSDYKSTMEIVKNRYPKTVFIHATVPLTYNQTGLKALYQKAKGFLKRILGKVDYGILYDNKKRNLFNEMVRKEYEGKEPIFDIAKVESTYPDGKREIYKSGGKSYFAMVPAYTDDGGHLNALGRKVVAENLLVLLAQYSK